MEVTKWLKPSELARRHVNARKIRRRFSGEPRGDAVDMLLPASWRKSPVFQWSLA
jgi:hypothetical protein